MKSISCVKNTNFVHLDAGCISRSDVLTKLIYGENLPRVVSKKRAAFMEACVFYKLHVRIEPMLFPGTKLRRGHCNLTAAKATL